MAKAVLTSKICTFAHTYSETGPKYRVQQQKLKNSSFTPLKHHYRPKIQKTSKNDVFSHFSIKKHQLSNFKQFCKFSQLILQDLKKK